MACSCNESRALARGPPESYSARASLSGVGWSKPAGEQVRAGVIYTDMKSGEDDMKHRVLRALVVTLVPLALAPFMAVALAPAAVAAETVRVGKAVPFAWTFTPIDVGIEVGIFTKQDLE